MDFLANATSPLRLLKGAFAPVFWEPLGRRGERLVVGVIIENEHGICHATPTLQHQHLLQYLNKERSDSAVGVMEFAFDHFNKTLQAGGRIEDLKTPFAKMAIGRVEPITARSEIELTERAIHLCTLLGRTPDGAEAKDAAKQSTARTREFMRDVRQIIAQINPQFARSALKTNRAYPLGGSSIKLHFHHKQNFAQFCSLPLPTARADAATECKARLLELITIRVREPSANIALLINTATRGMPHTGKTNTTELIRLQTLDMATTLNIPAKEYASAPDAAKFIQDIAEISSI